jgi:lipopolysaccharide/colanic/teichoic acid biosynthesis glycosyltransferase
MHIALRGKEFAAARPPHASRLSAQAIRLLLHFGQAVGDAAAIASGFIIVDMAYHRSAVPSVDSLSALVVPLLFALFAFSNRTYGQGALLSLNVSIGRALKSLALAFLTVLLVAFAVKESAELSRVIFVAGAVLAAALVTGERILIGNLIKGRLASRIATNILIADGVPVRNPDGFRVVDASQEGLAPDRRDPIALHRLGNLLHGADRVVVSCHPDRRADWSAMLKGSNLWAEIAVPELAAVRPIASASIGGVPTVPVSCGPLDLHNRITKRLFDLAVAVPAVVLLSPVLALVALAIRLEGPGPILFVQTRMGRGNRLFKVYKFRSMRAHLCDHDGNQSASRDDDRVTPLGRIIRALSIDELPQLLNVVLGDMSIVGPRPHALGSMAGDQLFWDVDQRYWHRHASKPGITGLAQVRGFRGATNRSADLSNRLESDLEYLTGWSIWRDLAILLATVRVLRHKNAF